MRLRLILEKLPLFALAAGSSMVTILIQRHGITPLDSLPLPLRAYNAPVSCITYIQQMFWPSGLAPFYPYPSGRLSILVPVFAIALLAFITYQAWILRKRYPYFITGWFWYLGMLMPVIGLLQVGQQGHADRYCYLPHIGLYLLVTWAVADVAARWSYQFAISGVAAAAVIIALSLSAWKQTSHWKNSEALWTHTLAVTSRNDVAHHDLGMDLLEHRKLDEAVAHLRESVRIRGNNARAQAGLAMALMEKGKTDESFLHWRISLQLQPEDVLVRDLFGVALIRQKRPYEAIAQWEQSLKYEPDDPAAQKDIALVLATTPDPWLRDGARAVQLAERALQLTGQRRPAFFSALAAAYAETGRFPLAIEIAKRGLQLATEQKDFAMAKELRQRISVLETNAPIRDNTLAPSTTSP